MSAAIRSCSCKVRSWKYASAVSEATASRIVSRAASVDSSSARAASSRRRYLPHRSSSKLRNPTALYASCVREA